MYDPATAKLIRSTPDLEGLDRDALPERLSEAFAQIAAARLRLRTGDVDDGTLAEIVREMRRLAFTNEALVSVFPERKNRAAAAYVSAAAHQLCFNARRIVSKNEAASFLTPQIISADISAMLLFLVAEATADAAEIARHVRWQTNNPIERRLIAALRALAQGRLTAIIEKALPDRKQVAQESAAETAASALYLVILEGVRALASRMLSSESKSANPVSNFRHVQSLSAEYLAEGDGLWSGQEISTFASPYHLASLMISVSTDLAESAVVAVPPPGGTDAGKWCSSLERFAKTRPFLSLQLRLPDAVA